MGPSQAPSLTARVTELQTSFHLEGASSAASVGLDIGGTLCKVVYFEPLLPDNAAGIRVPNAGFLGGPSCGFNLQAGEMAERTEAGCRKGPLQEGKEQSAHSKESLGRSKLADLGTVVEESGVAEDGPSSSLPVTGDPQTSHGLSRRLLSEARDRSEMRDCDVAPESREDTGGANYAGTGSVCLRGGLKAGDACPSNSDADQNGSHAQMQDLRTEQEQGETPSSDGVESGEDLWMSSHEPIVLPGKGTLHFKRFETWRVEDFLSLTRTHSLVNSNKAIGATGGGARKFAEAFKARAGIELRKEDELKCLLKGIDFLVRHAEDDSFEYETDAYRAGAIQRPLHSPDHSDDGSGDEQSKQTGCSGEELTETCCSDRACARKGFVDKDSMQKCCNDGGFKRKGFTEDGVRKKGSLARGIRSSSLTRLGAALEGAEDSAYPYLVVNIGSGVSILRVDARHVYERVGGTSLGGSTFLGLVSALTGCRTFEEAIAMAAAGDSTKVDMSVGDIYGGDYTEMGLAATVVASSFGKLVQPNGDKVAASPADLAKACLLMVTNNVGSLAMLHAKAAGVKRILFAGSFLHGNKVAMKLLSVAVEFWSKGGMKAVFLRHEGHAGAIGALLSGLDEAAVL